MKTWQKLKQNPKLWSRYLLRGQIYALIREFFVSRNFIEIEIPLLAPALPTESYLEIFATKLLDRNRNSQNAYLTTSPEMFLKKLLVAGAGNCFSITKSFRNTETNSFLHNPEFSILEWYRVNANYKDVMKDTEKLILYIYEQLKPNHTNKPILTYQNQTIDLSLPWQRLSVTQAFSKFAKIDLLSNLTLKKLNATASKKGYQINNQNTWEEVYNQIYLNEIEPHLGKSKPTIIYDFPSSMAALAKKKSSDPQFAERFEVYIGGLELGDAYSELTDAIEQEERFKKELQEIKRLNKTRYPIDSDFITALKTGLPRCSGLAMGLDRLIMLFANVPKIQDILFFPSDELWKKP